MSLRCMRINFMFWEEGSSHCSIYEVSRVVFMDMLWSLFKKIMYFKKPRMILQKENVKSSQINIYVRRRRTKMWTSINLCTFICIWIASYFIPCKAFSLSKWISCWQLIEKFLVVIIKQSCWNKMWRCPNRAGPLKIWGIKQKIHMAHLCLLSSTKLNMSKERFWILCYRKS